jgi:serine/threonine-protein phosphatase 2A regulatory subunit A
VVASACKILKQIGPNFKTQSSSYFELFKRLSNEEAGELFYSRVSGCYIIAELYSIVNDGDRLVLRDIYNRLCKDELPIVRRAACIAFIHLARIVDVDILFGEFLALLKALTADESQTIQVIAIESLVPFGNLLKKHNNTSALTTDVLPLVKAFADDPSWKLRLALAKGYSQFCTIFAAAEISADVFPALIHLIQDPEPEVRSLAILEVFPFLEIVGTTLFITELAPVALQLVDDPVTNMRKMLAELCVDVAAKVGPEAVAQHLSDLVMKLMEDEDPLVRLRIVKKLPIIAEEAPSLCTRLTELLKALYTNTNWRVRKELLLAMPAIVKHMGQDYFVDHFLNSFLLLLRDGVDEVRVACAVAITQIAAVSNVAWVYEKLFPSVRSMGTDDYLVRLTMLTALHGFLKLEQLNDKFQSEVVALAITATTDKVPNIRLRAAQVLTFASTLPHLDGCKNQILPVLLELQGDKDRDVKYFAVNASTK